MCLLDWDYLQLFYEIIINKCKEKGKIYFLPFTI